MINTYIYIYIYIYIIINGSKISVHRFIATTLFRMIEDSSGNNEPLLQMDYCYNKWIIVVIIIVDYCGIVIANGSSGNIEFVIG